MENLYCALTLQCALIQAYSKVCSCCLKSPPRSLSGLCYVRIYSLVQNTRADVYKAGFPFSSQPFMYGDYIAYDCWLGKVYDLKNQVILKLSNGARYFLLLNAP